MILVVITVFLIFTFGLLLINLVSPRLSILEKVGLAWPVGMGIYTFLLFLIQLPGLQLNSILVFTFLIFLNLILILIAGGKTKKFLTGLPKICQRQFPQLNIFSLSAAGVLIVLVGSAAARAFFWPVTYWDALAHFDYRARLIAQFGNITQAAANVGFSFHPYPPLTSLANSIFYIVGGATTSPLVFYALTYLSLAIIFYAVAINFVNYKLAVLFTILLVSTPLFWEHSASSYTNLPYAFYLGMAGVYFSRFFLTPEKSFFIIGLLLFLLATWTRSPNEPFFAAFILVLAIFTWKRKISWFYVGIFAGTFLLLDFIWLAYLKIVTTTPPVSLPLSLSWEISSYFDFPKLVRMADLLTQTGFKTLGSLLLVFLISFFLRFDKIQKYPYLMLLILSNLAVVIFGTYLFTIGWPFWENSILNSANRLIMFAGPILLFHTVLLWSKT